MLEAETPDRVGLLHDVLEAISACNADIAHAVIVTEEGKAADVFFLQGADGRKLHGTPRLEQIHSGVLAALG